MPRGKKTTGRGSSKKTTARRASADGGGVSDALVKKVMSLRKKGQTWDEIMEAGVVTVSQITPIRARMRELDPESVQNSGPSGGTRKSTKKKTTASAKKTGRKRGGKKTTARRRRRSAGEEGGSPN